MNHTIVKEFMGFLCYLLQIKTLVTKRKIRIAVVAVICIAFVWNIEAFVRVVITDKHHQNETVFNQSEALQDGRQQDLHDGRHRVTVVDCLYQGSCYAAKLVILIKDLIGQLLTGFIPAAILIPANVVLIRKVREQGEWTTLIEIFW